MTTATQTGWIQTFTGKKFPLFDPKPEDINIRDVAHALSLICRFGGHVRTPYSVAEHSIRVSLEVPRRDALWGLLHDASEAFIGDMSSPLKRSAVGDRYCDVEALIMRAVCDKYGLPHAMPDSVHLLDQVLLRTEQRDLFEYPIEHLGGPTPLPDIIRPWAADTAENLFLLRFRDLTKGAR